MFLSADMDWKTKTLGPLAAWGYRCSFKYFHQRIRQSWHIRFSETNICTFSRSIRWIHSWNVSIIYSHRVHCSRLSLIVRVLNQSDCQCQSELWVSRVKYGMSLGKIEWSSLLILPHDGVVKWKHFPRYWHLCGEFTGDTKATDAELWFLL